MRRDAALSRGSGVFKGSRLGGEDGAGAVSLEEEEGETQDSSVWLGDVASGGREVQEVNVKPLRDTPGSSGPGPVVYTGGTGKT